jgi:hypothetical protein
MAAAGVIDFMGDESYYKHWRHFFSVWTDYVQRMYEGAEPPRRHRFLLDDVADAVLVGIHSDLCAKWDALWEDVLCRFSHEWTLPSYAEIDVVQLLHDVFVATFGATLVDFNV